MQKFGTKLILFSLLAFVVACGDNDNNDLALPESAPNVPSSTPPPTGETGVAWSVVEVLEREPTLLPEDPISTPNENCNYKHTFEVNTRGEFTVGVNCEYTWTGRLTDGELAKLNVFMNAISRTEARALTCRSKAESDLLVDFKMQENSTRRSYSLWKASDQASSELCWSGTELEVRDALAVLNSFRSKYKDPTVQNPR